MSGNTYSFGTYTIRAKFRLGEMRWVGVTYNPTSRSLKWSSTIQPNRRLLWAVERVELSVKTRVRIVRRSDSTGTNLKPHQDNRERVQGG